MNATILGSSLRTLVFWSVALVWPAISPLRTPAQVEISLVPTGSVWKYLANGTEPAPAWRAAGFDDSSWASGFAELGYGDGDERTVIPFGPDPSNKYISYYFRRWFAVTNLASYSNLTLRLLADDGAVVYLNGSEVARVRLPAGTITYSTLATMAAEDVFTTMALTGNLVNGLNVIAVEVHQNSPVSSDVSFDLGLLASLTPPPSNSPPTAWLSYPTNGQSFVAGEDITLVARGNDPDGVMTIRRIDFYANATRLGTVTSPPIILDSIGWLLVWSNAPEGQFVLRTVLTDDHNASATSAPVHISVRTPLPPVWLGALKREVYTEIPGQTLDFLTNSPKYPNQPDLVDVVNSFEAPRDFADNYGQRLSGFLLPPTSGEYIFYISSDDQGALYLSPDDDPAHKVQIALESTWSAPRSWLSFGARTNEANISAPIRLEAGRRYYIEALMKEAGGGDSLGVAWQMPGEPPPNNGEPPIPGEYLATLAPATNLSPIVTIVSTDSQAGESLVNGQPDTATFKVSRTGSTEQSLGVMLSVLGTAKSGVDYTGAGSWVTIPAGQTSVEIAITPVDDLFIEEMETVIIRVEVPPVPAVIPAPPPAYWPGNPSQAMAWIADNDSPALMGYLKREVYTNIPGNTIADLTNAPKFPGQPDLVNLIDSFETPSDYSQNYGQRISGFIFPPVTGLYLFYIAADDQAVLYLSSDESPSNKQVIAREDTWGFPRAWTYSGGRTNRANISVPILLEAGGRYYVEALVKQGTGGDHFAVAWQLPDQPIPVDGSEPIAGQFLAPYPPHALPPQITQHPLSQTAYVGGTATFSVTAGGTPPLSYQWLFEGEELPGMTNSILHLTNLRAGDNGLYEVAVSNSAAVVLSQQAFLTVLPTPPGYVVTSSADQGPGSLRELLADAPAGATITFSVIGAIQLTSGPLILTKSVNVIGPGAFRLAVERSSATEVPPFRIMEVRSGVRAQISGLTIRNGLAANQGEDDGAGIENWGTLDLQDCVISDNYLWPDASRGAGLITWWSGTTTVNRCTFTRNHCGGGYGEGGAIYNYSTMAITNCTFSDNRAAATGAGIHQDALAGLLTVDSCTFSDNAAQGSSGLHVNGFDASNPSTVILRNNIIAGNSGQSDVGGSGRIVSSGYNLFGQVATTFAAGPQDRFGVSAEQLRLGALEDNGGLTPTRALLRHSAALDAGPTTAFPPTDQRGLARPIGPRADIGAFEAENFPNNPPWVNCPGPVEWHAGVSQTASGTLSVAVGDLDGDPLIVLWRVDGMVYRTNHVGADLAGGVTLSESFTLPLGSHQVEVSVSDGIAAPATGTIGVTVVVETMPAPQDQGSPAIASDGSNFLVVWLDRRSYPSADWTQCDVYGARISSTGTVMDPEGFLIARHSFWASAPAVGFDGNNYLVVWEYNPDGNPTNLYGTRVSREGVVLDGTAGFPIGKPTRTIQTTPSVAFNGQVWLVCWIDWRNMSTNSAENMISDIYGARVSTGGQVLDPENIPIIVAPMWQSEPSVVSIGGEFLVGWQDNIGNKAARVSGSGIVSPPGPAFSGPWGSVQAPVLAENDSNIMAVWNNSFNVGGNNVWYWLSGTRLSPTGVPLDVPAFAVRTNDSGRNLEVDLVSAGSDYWAVWTDSDPYATNSNIWGTRISAAGVAAPAKAVTLNPKEQTQPAIGWNGSKLLVAWRDLRNASDSSYYHERHADIYATFMSSAGEVLNPEGLLISGVVRHAPIVTWDSPENIIYGTALSRQQLDATASVPGRFVYDPPAGTVLPAGEHVLSMTFFPTDSDLYIPVETIVSISVDPKALTITADNKIKLQGAVNPPLTASYSGLVNGDIPASLDTPVTLTTSATVDSPGGRYPILATGASDPNYIITHVNGILRVVTPAGSPGSIDAAFAASIDDGMGVLAIATQGNGSIVIGGDFQLINGQARSGLARLLPDGTLDESFDPWLGEYARVSALAIQPDGRILVGGEFRSVGDTARYGLARLLADGSLDMAFDPMGSNESVWGVRSMVLQPDGKILIGGWFPNIQETDRVVLARLHPDGRVDTEFDPGQVTIWESDDLVVRAMALQGDGKLLAIGNFTEIGGYPVGDFVRLNNDGTLDRTFEAIEAAEEDLSAHGLAIQPDGRIVVANADGSEIPVVRLESDGSMDSTFILDPALRGWGDTVALQPDGKILLGYYDSQQSGRTVVVRLNGDGTLDPGFYAGTGANSAIRQIVLESSGKILVGGYFTEFDGIDRGGLVRLDNDLLPSSFVQRHVTRPVVQLVATPSTDTGVYAVEDQVNPEAVLGNISDNGVFDPVTRKVKFGPFYDNQPRTLSYSVVIPPGCIYGLCGAFHFTGTASADGVNTPIGGENSLVIVGLHPADYAPTDQNLGIAEITAYGAAWRRGETWPVGPGVIPLDYVTRAAGLWRMGECYTVNAAIDDEPLWWVSCPEMDVVGPMPVLATLSQLVTSPSSAVSDLPGVYVPGQPLTVQIRVYPEQGTMAWAVEDQPPAGWSIGMITAGGELDAVNGKVKWGPYTDATSRILSYQATPPLVATGQVSFSGTASFEGASTAIAGSRTLRAGCKTNLRIEAGTGFMLLRVTGAPGAKYLVESSVDLETWVGLERIISEGEEVIVANPNLAGVQWRFWRARQF